MKYCDIEERRYSMICMDHYEVADHVATDGNTPICKVYAKRYGCNCGHYEDRGNESGPIKALRALSDALECENGYDTSEIDSRALSAVQSAVERAIRELSED